MQIEQFDAGFDKRRAILEARRLALTRALQSVVKAQDFKALMGTAQNALKVVATLDCKRPQWEDAARRKCPFRALQRSEQRIRDVGSEDASHVRPHGR